jgi:hypothetical protein
MGFFIKHMPNGGETKYVTEAEFLENLQMQTFLVKRTLEKLHHFSVVENKGTEVAFFFYTNAQEKAGELASSLKRRGYSVWHGPSDYDDKLYVVKGWTEKMSTDEEILGNWVKEMCQLGFAYDCEFDGWEIKTDWRKDK